MAEFFDIRIQSILLVIIIMGGEGTDFLKRIVDEFHCLKGIVLSDSDGILICHSVPPKDN